MVVENDEVDIVGGGGRADETDEISAKSKNIKILSKAKKSAKARRSEQLTFLSSKASSVFESPSEWLIVHLCRLSNTESLNSCQGKANEAADALFLLPQRSFEEERFLPLRSQPPFRGQSLAFPIESSSTAPTSYRYVSFRTHSEANLALLSNLLLRNSRLTSSYVGSVIFPEPSWPTKSSYKATIGGMRPRLPELQRYCSTKAYCSYHEVI